ncbi:MAG: 7-carboxy-7-deazaguanine synthase QueE [Bacillaceae bacterium]
MKRNIPVIEIFGPTIQGEGVLIGQKTMFVRTAGCDYQCSWCDSAFTWDGSEKEKIVMMNAEEVVQELFTKGKQSFSHVTLSGGNPVLINGLRDVVQLLKEQNIKIAVETQGSKWNEWLLDIEEITISPKPPSSKMKVDFEKLDDIMNRLTGKNVALKIVIFDDADFQFAEGVYRRYKGIPLVLQVGNNDVKEGDINALRQRLMEKYEHLIEKTIHASMTDVRVLPQLHTLLWGNKRGV